MAFKERVSVDGKLLYVETHQGTSPNMTTDALPHCITNTTNTGSPSYYFVVNREIYPCQRNSVMRIEYVQLPEDKESKPPGLKVDTGKPDWDLLPIEPLEEIIKAFQDGNIKYERDNWKEQDGEVRRDYYNASMRHLTATKKGEVFIPDPKSNVKVRHLASLGADVLIMLWHEMEAEHKAKK